MKIEIDAGGRKVTVECGDTNTSPKEVLADALAAWRDTVGGRDGAGSAYGFVTAERRDRQVAPLNAWMTEPKAGGEE
jgi:hypothetical protein